MTEATVVGKMIPELKKQLPGAVIFKINDISTTGIPDVAVNYRGHVTWVEVKFIRKGETFSQFNRHFKRLQLATARLLDRQVNTYYFIAAWDGSALIARPDWVADFLEYKTTDLSSFGGALYRGGVDEGVTHLAHLARGSQS